MAQRTDDGALLLTGLPRQRVGPGRAVLAVGGPALAPLADGLGRDAVTLGQHAGALVRAGDLGADSRRRAGIKRALARTIKPPGIFLDRPTHLIPTTFRIQT